MEALQACLGDCTIEVPDEACRIPAMVKDEVSDPWEVLSRTFKKPRNSNADPEDPPSIGGLIIQKGMTISCLVDSLD